MNKEQNHSLSTTGSVQAGHNSRMGRSIKLAGGRARLNLLISLFVADNVYLTSFGIAGTKPAMGP